MLKDLLNQVPLAQGEVSGDPPSDSEPGQQGFGG